MVGLKVGVSGVAETPVPDLIREFGERPHYTPEGERQFRALFANGPPPDQKACHFGFPFLMLESPLFFEVLITPRETAMIFSGREVRHIYTDGRKHPPSDELWPTPWGDSIGHWEGDTLVVEDQMTVYDPLFSEPWRITHRYRHTAGIDRMVHEDCEGNERNPIVDGKFTLK